MSETVAVVLAAGRGTRFGHPVNKVYLPLGGRPVLVRALEPFQASPLVDRIVLVIAADDDAYCRREVLGRYPLSRVRNVVHGGATRAESEYRALDALRGDVESGRVGVVLVHDAARPLVRAELIGRLLEALPTTGASIPAVPAESPILRLGAEGLVEAVYRPSEAWRVQTPQAFDARLLLDCYDRARAAGFEGTDTASVVEWAGHEVRVVPGDARNLKITTEQDLRRAEVLLRTLR